MKFFHRKDYQERNQSKDQIPKRDSRSLLGIWIPFKL